MAFRATLWPLASVSGWISTSLKRRLVLPVPERYCTSTAGRYKGKSKALPTRSPVFMMAPTFRFSWLRANELLLACRWPLGLTTIRVVLLAATALKEVPLAVTRPPLPITICVVDEIACVHDGANIQIQLA